jgi:hypothetical protein
MHFFSFPSFSTVYDSLSSSFIWAYRIFDTSHDMMKLEVVLLSLLITELER